MPAINFYHLTQSSLEDVLPALLVKARQTGSSIIIKAPNETRLEMLNNFLWVFDPNSFLPHGAAKDGNAAAQPIYLTTGDEKPNGAELLVLIDGVEGEISDYTKCLDIFDGMNEESLTAARARWQRYKQAGYEVKYFQQQEGQGWKQAA
ncbi:MAG: DNA polymerase III subunit chi [Dongiaceae bacterium]